MTKPNDKSDEAMSASQDSGQSLAALANYGDLALNLAAPMRAALQKEK